MMILMMAMMMVTTVHLCHCQDFKLNTLRWHLLPKLGQVLIDLAAILNASEHIDFYQRDLGPSLAPASLQQLNPAGQQVLVPGAKYPGPLSGKDA